jgi:hypothetical protein
MAIFNFFRPPTIRRFDYKPIYYDPAKEEREERLARIKQELGMQDENQPYKPTIRRGVFHEQRKVKARGNQNRIIRLLIVFLVVIGLVYWLF